MRWVLKNALCAGSLICAPAAVGQEAAPAAPVTYDVQNGYNLAFVDADVRRVVDAVLGSMLEADYTVDDGVSGNITLRTAQPVTRASLIPLLEQALRSVDAVIIQDGSSYRVVPRAGARARAPLGQAGPDGVVAGYASEVVDLKQASAREMARLLEQFIGKEIVAGTNDARNQVVITGTLAERTAARRLIERFDVDALANMEFELIRLENVDAETLDRELQRIFQPPYDIIGSRVRVIPLPRLRSILMIAADRADIARLQPWIQRLDAGVAGKRKLYSYAVQNGRARDLARGLQQVLGNAAPFEDVEPLGVSEVAPATVDALSPRDQGANEPPVIMPLLSAPQPQSSAGPRIVPNEANNSLLIYADGEEYEFIRQALESLDQPVPQVLIEATLAEVTLTDDFRFGVNFDAIGSDVRVTQSNADTGLPTAIFPGASVSLITGSIQAILNTLQAKTNVRVLSAPKLLVLNNQTATLQVGDQVPIVVQQSQGVSAPGAPIVNSIEMRDTGVILEVTPRVNDSGVITLDISQEVSDVTETTTSSLPSPTIQQRKIESTVATRSGQIVALGGLIRDRTVQSRRGVPLLSQIPVIGGLFGTESTDGTRTELIILLTPTVIRSPDDVRPIVDELIDRLDKTRPIVMDERARQVGGNVQAP